METVFSNLNTKMSFGPIDDAKLMKCDLVSRVKHIQMDPNSRLSTYVDEKTAPSKVVTDVVPATTSPMPKSKWEKKCFLKEK